MGEVVRYEIPSIGALNFVMQKALGGGVTPVPSHWTRTASAWHQRSWRWKSPSLKTDAPMALGPDVLPLVPEPVFFFFR